jgi:hypothetical protein
MGRAERARGADVRLRRRDEALLTALARFRAARTSDLVLLGFPRTRRDTATARLRRLFDSGYLDVHVGDLAKENVYSLGTAGRRVVENLGTTPASPPSGALDHHLAIVRAWVQLAAAARVVPGFALERVEPDWELRRRLGHAPAAISPDAFIQSRMPSGDGGVSVQFALEVDRRTERGAHLREKVRAYERSRIAGRSVAGWTDFGLAVALENAGPRRTDAVRSLIESGWGGWSILWRLEDGVESALREVAAALGAPLTNSLYSKGRVGDGSRYVGSEADREGRGSSR